jgi:hypothetical protein
MLKFCNSNQKDVADILPIQSLREQQEEQLLPVVGNEDEQQQASRDVVSVFAVQKMIETAVIDTVKREIDTKDISWSEVHNSSPIIISPKSITTPPFVVLSMTKSVFFTLLLFGTIHFFVLVRPEK